MVLRYMVSDTDLAKGRAVQPAKEVAPQQSTKAPRKKRTRFWVLVVANVILWTWFCGSWATGKKLSLWKPFMIDSLMVTGIIYDTENPSAVVCGEIVREGDTVKGYKVTKIYRDKVEFKGRRKNFTRKVCK